MRGFVLLVLFAFIIRGCGGPIIPDEGDNKDTLRDKPSKSDTDSNSGTRKIVISPHQEGSNNKQTTEINPFYLTKNLTVNHYKIYQYNFDIHFHFGDSAINITEIISGIVNGNLFIPKKIESLDGRFSFDSNAFINKDSIISQKDNYVITANKKTNGDYELAIFDTDTTVINPPPMEFKVTYAPVIENNYYKYIGTIINEQPNGQGTLIVKEDGYRPNNNSSITANKGDVFIGDFKEGQATQYTQIDKNGDTLRTNHFPSEYDIIFNICDSDLNNDSLYKKKHVDIRLGELLAEFNMCFDQGMKPELKQFSSYLTERAHNMLLNYWETDAHFYYDTKKNGNICYKIEHNSNGYFIGIPINRKSKIKKDTLKITFNNQWQISGLNYQLVPDDIMCEKIDSITQPRIYVALENFRLNYNSSNINRLRQLYDPLATIKVGLVLPDTIILEDRTSDTYGDNLQKIFNKKTVHIGFAYRDVCLLYSNDRYDYFLIKTEQDWRSNNLFSFYHDLGWLTMIWKMEKNTDTPIILLRVWSDKKDKQIDKDLIDKYIKLEIIP